MGYRLGVDVGGTFTDLLLVNESDGSTHTAKVPSTPRDSSIGVLTGINRVCSNAGVDPSQITQVMHGTTVATNTMLTMTGARVGLVTTQGYRQVLQIARSFVPGGLGGWVVYNQSKPLAPLALTVEADERIGADGGIVRKLDERQIRAALQGLAKKGVEAITVSLINSFANPAHERAIARIARQVLPGIPISLSSTVVPEMQEYERTVTTVADAYVKPRVATYVKNLQRQLKRTMKQVNLHVLRSDGGLASAKAAQKTPVNLLMSGPAGGVAGAVWIAEQAGFSDLMTFDMGGTSTDVCLVEGGRAQLRRETTVGDVTVRASSIDVRTVGAGGGSIAHVPELTRALRVGPDSAGADPGPAAYGQGGLAPTVTDANVVLGFLPPAARLGGDMELHRDKAEVAVGSVARALGLSLDQAAAGIVDIVNENMFGALRLVSVEKGYDPRDFALVAFGGAGPLHANALGRLMSSWPVIIPPGPGVLCAYGDATTRVRDEASRTFVKRFGATNAAAVRGHLDKLARQAGKSLTAEGVSEREQSVHFEADIRYSGQGLSLTVDVDLRTLSKRGGLDAIGAQFDEKHEQLFTFALDAEKEFVNLRAVAQGQAAQVVAAKIGRGRGEPKAASIGTQMIYADRRRQRATVYDRGRLRAGHVIRGPAIVIEMDSTTVVLPANTAKVDRFGNLLITPV
jgi:N-methylhydantoinase A